MSARITSAEGRTSHPVSDEILVERGRVAVVTFNRPSKRNALTLAMWRRLAAIFEELDYAPEVRAIILTGAESFSAGADISEFPTVRATLEQGAVYEHAVDAAQLAITQSTKPTIAAISGYCLGGGMEVAQSCDFRVADSNAVFAIPAARMGIVYSELACRRLVAIVGLTNAKTILFQGDRFDADQAQTLGFAVRVEAPAMSAALGLAQKIAENAPIAVAGMKLILDSVADGTAHTKREQIEGLMQKALLSNDHREAVEAFKARRPPRFSGS